MKTNVVKLVYLGAPLNGNALSNFMQITLRVRFMVDIKY